MFCGWPPLVQSQVIIQVAEALKQEGIQVGSAAAGIHLLRARDSISPPVATGPAHA
jgi:hypothetical protein